MLVPQGMAYAMLAGLPPVTGLYASTLPLIAYALSGSSRQLAVGPVAMMSLLVFAGVSPLAEPGSERFLSLVPLLTFLVGAMQGLMGVLRTGFLVNFLSRAVISGFTSGAALIILASQIPQILGLSFQSRHSVLHLVAEACRRIGEAHPLSVAIGMAGVLLLVILRKIGPRFPAALFVVAGATMTVALFRLDQAGVAVVGPVPAGLPRLSFPSVEVAWAVELLPAALTVLFVGFLESVSVARWVAAREKYKINADQELRALGMANLAAAFLSAAPVTGGFSRTAVNYEAGARTGLASLITALLVAATLLFFTPLFHHLPKAVLAALIMVAVSGLIDVKEAVRLFHVKPVDGWTLVATFAVTLFLGSETGILAGVAFSLTVFIWRSAHPHAAELGFLEEERVFRNLKRFPRGRTFPEALILRIDASLYFANLSFVEELLHRDLADRPGVKWVILDLSGVNDIDAVAVEALEEIMESYKAGGIRFVFAGMKGPVRDLVSRADWQRKVGEWMSPLSVEQALRKIGLL
jgi:sulfate permease, SulP family